ncbi:hypothetical protein SAMN04515675_4782 [Pseudomonas costantinii]|uniref:Uncharacterized protein n=1 Tax=Pseudomonas costantinii TaxID=168469 RepID=A0A1H5HLC4_9PSED|nr:hypothetical protein SAMN04515675_4782 [Pseudomonas costantinii]
MGVEISEHYFGSNGDQPWERRCDDSTCSHRPSHILIRFLQGKPGYLPGVRVSLVFPYALSKFCGCIGKLRYCALSDGSMPFA